MESNVLVAFASKYGSTAEIAAAIGRVLARSGLPAHTLPAHEVADLIPYFAVIVGSAVYASQWRTEAIQFLELHEHSLAARPLYLFSSGPTGKGDPVSLLNGWRFPADQVALARRLHPRGLAVFHGCLQPEKLHFSEKQMLHNVGIPAGDYRDWAAIEAWAQGVADALAWELLTHDDAAS